MEAGISRRHGRACAEGGGRTLDSHKMAAAAPAVGRAARAQLPPPTPSPDSTVPESPSPPADTPGRHTPTPAHYSRGSAKEEVKEAGRGTQPRRKNDQNQDRPSTFTSPQTRPQGRRAPAPTSSKLRSLDAVLRKESSPGH